MEPVSVVITFVALSIGAFLKGITGLGLPVIALPVLSYFLGLPHAIGILIMPILITNLHQSIQTRAALPEVMFLWPALATGTFGLIAGAWVLLVMSPDRLNLGLGLMLFVYIGLRVFNPRFTLTRTTTSRLSPIAGFFGGLAQGSTGLCAAVMVPFVQSAPLSRVATVFTISTVFLVFAFVQFITLLVAGLLQRSFLLEGLLALIPVAIFMPLGSWLSPRLSRSLFDRVFLIILTAVAIGLIGEGLVDLLNRRFRGVRREDPWSEGDGELSWDSCITSPWRRRFAEPKVEER